MKATTTRLSILLHRTEHSSASLYRPGKSSIVSFDTKSKMHKAPAAILTRPIATDTSIHQPRDPNTLSNYNAWRCRHVTASLEIDFGGKKISGNVLLSLRKQHADAQQIVLDTRWDSMTDHTPAHSNGIASWTSKMSRSEDNPRNGILGHASSLTVAH